MSATDLLLFFGGLVTVWAIGFGGGLALTYVKRIADQIV